MARDKDVLPALTERTVLTLMDWPRHCAEDGVKAMLPRLPPRLGAAALGLASHWSFRLGRLGFRGAAPPAALEHFVRHRCIFVHIPKCAGTSVSRTLSDRPALHWKLSYYRLVFQPDAFRDYFKFAFVRNPWDRLVSAYQYLREPTDLVAESDVAWAKRHLARYADFADFALHGLPRWEVRRWLTFVPQHEFVTLPWRRGPQVDFIGKVEDIGRDWPWVAQRLGLPPGLGTFNRSRRAAGYRGYYTPQTRAMVARVYAEDIRMFGYEF
jgi:hypothetical protein